MNPNLGGMPAILVSVIAIAAVVGFCVLFAFWESTMRFVRAQMAGGATMTDRLGGGIFVTAMGTAIAGATIVCRELHAPAPTIIELIAWVMIAVGYFLHFTAWQAAAKGRAHRFSLGWVLVFAVVGGCTYFAMTMIRWPHI